MFLFELYFRISGFSGPRCSGSLLTKLRYEAMSTRLHVLDVYEARLSCSVYEARSTRLHVLELEPKWLPQHTFSTIHVLTRFAPQVESCASELSYTCYIDIWCFSWVAGLLPSPYMHQASCINICNMRICYPLGCLKLRESATSPSLVIMRVVAVWVFGFGMWFPVSYH